MKTSLSRSWQYIAPDHYEEMAPLLREREKLIPGNYPVLWQTRNKFVILLTLPSGRKAVYKAPVKIKNFLKYCFRLSPYGKEARNFRLIGQMGIPTVKIIASGEERTFFRLKSGFLVSEFAEGFSDGNDFSRKGALKDEKELVREFVEENFRLLALMHNNRFIHKGFTPGNILYRKRSLPDEKGRRLEIKWIDLASCHQLASGQSYEVHTARDLALFFHYFDFSEEEKRSFVEAYCRHILHPGVTAGKVMKAIAANPVR